MVNRMRIVYFGKGKRGKVCLDKLIEDGLQIVGFIGESEKDECLKFANKMGIKTLLPRLVNSSSSEKEIQSFKADLFILSGYSKIIKNNIIS
ncbi:hypothetical protein HN615_09285, partial [Candidatus Woesearchaeota archaeon]|nr:hypothetical protein [Candidatus Woesearchaeota archaeon]